MRKYTVNHDAFNKLDTPEKAYMLGFMYADGYNESSKRRVFCGIQYKDSYILKDFLKIVGSNAPVNKILRNYKDSGLSDVGTISISSEKISNRFISLGCPIKKTFILKFPSEKQVRIKLLPHFIRGYFDGDGCLSYNTTQKKYFRGGVYIVSTLHFCEKLALLLKNKLGIHCSICIKNKRYKNKKFPIRTLSIGGNRQIQKFLDWIYYDSTIHLKRKYKKYLEFSRKNKKQAEKYGEKRKFKLDFKKANLIRKLYKNGESARSIAKKFNIDYSLVFLIKNNKIWNRPNIYQDNNYNSQSYSKQS